jgi:hypothetical protein
MNVGSAASKIASALGLFEAQVRITDEDILLVSDTSHREGAMYKLPSPVVTHGYVVGDCTLLDVQGTWDKPATYYGGWTYFEGRRQLLVGGDQVVVVSSYTEGNMIYRAFTQLWVRPIVAGWSHERLVTSFNSLCEEANVEVRKWN